MTDYCEAVSMLTFLLLGGDEEEEALFQREKKEKSREPRRTGVVEHTCTSPPRLSS